MKKSKTKNKLILTCLEDWISSRFEDWGSGQVFEWLLLERLEREPLKISGKNESRPWRALHIILTSLRA
jgi:hypothetical protein